MKNHPKKLHTYGSWKFFSLCSPDCQKQPRTSFSFYKLFYPIVSAKVSGWQTYVCKNYIQLFKYISCILSIGSGRHWTNHLIEMATGIRSSRHLNCDGSVIVVLDHFLDNFTTRRSNRAPNDVQKNNKGVEIEMPEFKDFIVDTRKFYQHRWVKFNLTQWTARMV